MRLWKCSSTAAAPPANSSSCGSRLITSQPSPGKPKEVARINSRSRARQQPQSGLVIALKGGNPQDGIPTGFRRQPGHHFLPGEQAIEELPGCAPPGR